MDGTQPSHSRELDDTFSSNPDMHKASELGVMMDLDVEIQR